MTMSNEKSLEDTPKKEVVYHIERGSNKEEGVWDTLPPRSTNHAPSSAESNPLSKDREPLTAEQLQKKVDLFNEDFTELQKKHGFAVIPEVYLKDGVLNARVGITLFNGNNE